MEPAIRLRIGALKVQLTEWLSSLEPPTRDQIETALRDLSLLLYLSEPQQGWEASPAPAVNSPICAQPSSPILTMTQSGFVVSTQSRSKLEAMRRPAPFCRRSCSTTSLLTWQSGGQPLRRRWAKGSRLKLRLRSLIGERSDAR